MKRQVLQMMVTMILVSSVYAQTSYDISSDGGEWTTAGTWDPSIAGGPTASDTIDIRAAGADATISLDGAADTIYTIDGLTFDSTRNVKFFGAVRYSGPKTLSISGDVTKAGTGLLIFNGFFPDDPTTLNIQGGLSVDSGTLVMGAPQGSFSLSVSNGTTVASGAILNIQGESSSSSFASFGSTALSGTINYNMPTVVARTVVVSYGGLSGTGTITVGSDTVITAGVLFNHTSGSSTFSGSISDSGAGDSTIFLTSDGGGTQILTGSLSYRGITQVLNNGVLVFAGSSSFGADNIRVGSGSDPIGGVLGLGNSDLTLDVGAGAGYLRIWSGGFAAYGADRTVSFGGLATPTALKWGSSSFFQGGYNTLTLSADTATHTLIFANGIDLNRVARTFLVLNGAADVDARITGTLSSGAGSIIKSGAGVLALTGANSFSGGTTVSNGTLLAENTAGSATGSGIINVSESGTLGGTGTVAASASSKTISIDGTLMGGDGSSTTGTALKVTSTGGISLNDNSVIKLTLGEGNTHSSIDFTGNTGNVTFDINQKFTFINPQEGFYDNILLAVGTDPGTTESWLVTNEEFTGTFTYDGANIDLTLEITPDRGTLMIIN